MYRLPGNRNQTCWSTTILFLGLTGGFTGCQSTQKATSTEDTEEEPPPPTECSITLESNVDSTHPHINVTAQGATNVVMTLLLYGERETVQRRLQVDPYQRHELNMFWPQITTGNSWQEIYGTQAKLVVTGTTADENQCSAELDGEFADTPTNLDAFKPVNQINWQTENLTANGLLISVPAIQTPEKYIVIQTALSYTQLATHGTFSLLNGFNDITSADVFESQSGALISITAQEGWPDFDEVNIDLRDAITGQEIEQFAIDTILHHNISAVENSDGSIQILSSEWEERLETGQQNPRPISFPIEFTIQGNQISNYSALMDWQAMYPNPPNRPNISYNNYTMPADPNWRFIGATFFANDGINLPEPTENASAVWFFDRETQQGTWFANQGKGAEVFTAAQDVIELANMPDGGPAIVFPHAVQFDGETVYIQDHVGIEQAQTGTKINAYTPEGQYLWTYTTPFEPSSDDIPRRRHGGLWLIEADEQVAICAFFVDSNGTYCVDKNGSEIGVLSAVNVEEPLYGKWHLLSYLDNWENTVTP